MVEFAEGKQGYKYSMKQGPAEPRATLYGVLLLLLLILYVYMHGRITDPIVDFVFKAIAGITNLGFIFYGQSLVKRLNRNYIPWAAAVFLATPFALIILGRLSRVEKIIPLDYITEEQSRNVNNLPVIYLRTGSSELPEALTNDTFTLQHLLNNYSDYLKDYTRLFPVAAAYELNRRNILLTPELLGRLDQFAQENGQPSFRHLIDVIKPLAPWEMIERYN
jgi:hypothetical protein